MRKPGIVVVILLALVASSAGCTTSQCAAVRALPGEPRILVVGDSVLAWNDDRCQAVGDHLALALGEPVRSEAVSGTRLLDGEQPIPTQVVPGDFRVYVVDGGGNDLNTTCDCGPCEDVLDRLASEDGQTGAMPDLVDELTARGGHVLLVRYYEVPDGAWYGFDECHETIRRLGDRYDRLAASRPNVTLVDAREVISPAQPELYALDKVHPSDEGAKRLAARLAEVIAARR